MELLLRNRFLSKKLKSINLPGYVFLSVNLKKQIKINKKIFYCLCKHLNYKIDLTDLEIYKPCRNYQTSIKNNHFACFKFLYKTGKIFLDKHVSKEISKYGLLKFLKYAHEQGCPFGGDICLHTAQNNQFDCLKYLYEQGYPWDEQTCRYIVHNGQLDCLKYLHEQGYPWNKDTCRYAAEGGNLDCLKYLHEQGCSWDEDTCIYSSYFGNFDCLEYARENGCPE